MDLFRLNSMDSNINQESLTLKSNFFWESKQPNILYIIKCSAEGVELAKRVIAHSSAKNDFNLIEKLFKCSITFKLSRNWGKIQLAYVGKKGHKGLLLTYLKVTQYSSENKMKEKHGQASVVSYNFHSVSWTLNQN